MEKKYRSVGTFPKFLSKQVLS